MFSLRLRNFVLRFSIIFAVFGALPRAIADTTADKKRATALLQEGAKLLDKRDYAAALDRFTEAYGLVASAKIQFNIGLAQEGMDHPAEAIHAYRIYIDEATTDLAARRSDARVRIDALRPHVAQISINADVPGALVLIDGVEEGHTPLARPAVVDPGVHQVVVQSPAGGIAFTKTVRGEAGAKVDLQVALTAAGGPLLPSPPPLSGKVSDRAPADTAAPLIAQPPAADTPPDSTPVYKKAWFWGVIAGVVAAGTVGAVVATRGGGSNPTFVCDVPPCVGGRP